MAWDDIPPPPEEPPADYGDAGPWDDAAYGSATGADDGAPGYIQSHVDYDTRPQRDDEPSLGSQVLQTLRRVLAAMHDRPASTLLETIDHMRAAKRVFKALPERSQPVYTALVEALEHAATHTSGNVDLFDVPAVTEFDVYDREVAAELAAVQAHVGTHADDADPQLAWFTLVEKVQRHAAREGYETAITAIDRKAPARSLMVIHRELELPTSQGGTSAGDNEPLTAAEWEVEIERRRAGSDLLRISSGYRTLDLSATSPGESLGWITCGEFNIKAAGTGQGKSSDASVAVPAAAQDLVNQGLPDGRVLLLHTEEEEDVKLTQMQLWSGMRNHHLAGNIAVRKVGTRLQRAATAVYDSVIRAVKEAKGGDITPYLPYVCYVDYIQAMKADPSMKESDAVAQSANFFLYGVGAWDFEEMALYSGVDFREYAGMAVPDGMEAHRVAVICYAQLIKQSGDRQFFKPNHRATPPGDFTVEGPSGEPGWEPLPGDLRIPTQDEVRGGGQLLQHASNLIFLHRSRPQQPIIRPKGAPAYLADRRARFILSKTRNGADMAFVPMQFSSNPNPGVNKGQYFDFLAEQAMAEGRFRPDVSWQQTGDMIVPRRKVSNPLAGVRY